MQNIQVNRRIWSRFNISRIVPTFKYSPLRSGEIRLARLEWTTSLDPQDEFHQPAPNTRIHCTITHHSLSNPPPYTALSYCWGEIKRESVPPLTLSMSDRNGPLSSVPAGIQIGKNLYQFLRRARPDPGSTNSPDELGHSSSLASRVEYLWVDALCIDQNNLEEKAVQIPLMRKIYSSACRIIMWLGSGSPATERTMDIYRRIAQHGSALNHTSVLSEKDCIALDYLERNRYWTRSWVYPEASTPRVPRELWLGVEKIPFEDVIRANNIIANQLMKTPAARQPQPNPFVPAISKLDQLTTKRAKSDKSLTLLDLLVMTYRLQASIQVDKIYALLDIYNDTQDLGDDALQIDYSLPSKQVHRDLAIHVIERTGSLDVLLLCSAAKAWSKKQCSWVPNFAQLRTERAYDLRLQYNAGGHDRASFRVDSDTGTFKVTGVRIDTVTKVHPCMVRPLDRQENMNWKNDQYWGPVFSRWMQSLSYFLFAPEGARGSGLMRDRFYAYGGMVSNSADWILSLGVSTDLAMTRTSTIHKWPWPLGIGMGEMMGSAWSALARGAPFPHFLHRMRNRTVFWTSREYLGAGDADVAEGDVVVVLPGLNIPMIFRAVDDDDDKGRPHWRVIGPCFVKGIMDGEGLFSQRREEFVLI
ncbi:heterokaryon incompatibility protein-domain-containing protein [Cladorrhinum sp. PSN259]|nr:heterokaryon incompatibility protein-domain-containing protein [Cladorrhinum sp. PSN259]